MLEVPWESFYARPFLGLVSLMNVLVGKNLSFGNYLQSRLFPELYLPEVITSEVMLLFFL